MRWNTLSAVVCFVALLVSVCNAQTSPAPSDRAAWMSDAKFGVMNHYLADWIARRENVAGGRLTVEQWNDMIDAFDVDRLADQLKSVGAAYHVFTIGQNSGFYCSPNSTYDKIVGIMPSKCSKRDLVADLAGALRQRGIKLIVYLPAGAPNGDKEAREKLQWRNGAHPNKEFQQHWEAIIREWSTRWGDSVEGWWFDGCYWPNTMYRNDDPPNFQSFAAAARAGNPNSAVAFNPGVVYRTMSVTPHEDYIAGEIDHPEKWSPKRHAEGKVDGARLHVLSYLGQRWGAGDPRFADEQVATFSRAVTHLRGAVTWDVPINADGTIPQPFIDQLSAAGKALRSE